MRESKTKIVKEIYNKILLLHNSTRFFENTAKHQTTVKVSIFKIKDKKLFSFTIHELILFSRKIPQGVLPNDIDSS